MLTSFINSTDLNVTWPQKHVSSTKQTLGGAIVSSDNGQVNSHLTGDTEAPEIISRLLDYQRYAEWEFYYLVIGPEILITPQKEEINIIK